MKEKQEINQRVRLEHLTRKMNECLEECDQLGLGMVGVKLSEALYLLDYKDLKK